MNIILYSTGCPQCKVLKSKLDQEGIDYTIVTDETKMQELGIMYAPALEVDGAIMDFIGAVHWLRDRAYGN